MAAAFGGMKLSVEKTGQSVTIPNNHKARLMYYLDCMCHALDMSRSETSGIQRLRNYLNYYSLSESETKELFVMCAVLSPVILLNKVIFQDDDMCGDSGNTFYKISAVQHRFVVSQSILIAGQSRSVNKIMTFKMSWLRKNYLNPMEYYKNELEEAENRRKRAEEAENRRKRVEKAKNRRKRAEEAENRRKRVDEERCRKKDDSCVIL